MLNQYATLKILAQIAESSAKPTQYQCTPREMILRSDSDWEKMNQDLQKLESESLVQISHTANIQFSITSKGLEKICALEGKPMPRRH